MFEWKRFGVILGVLAALSGCNQGQTPEDVVSTDELLGVDLSLADPKAREFLTARQKSVQDNPTNADSVGKLAMSYEMNGFADIALRGYQRASELDASAPEWPYYEALLLASFGDYEKALSRLEESIQLEEAFGPAWVWRGRWYLELNDLDAAQASFEQALELDQEIAANVGLAQLMLRRDENREAMELLLELIDKAYHPKIDQLLQRARHRIGVADTSVKSRFEYATGDIALNDSRTQEKLKFEQSISASLDRYVKWVKQEETKGQAFKLIDELYFALPDDERVVTHRIGALVMQNRFADVSALSIPALEKWPNNQTMLLSLASLETNFGDMVHAIALTEQALRKLPNSESEYLLRGALHVKMGELQQALEHFNQSLEVQETTEVHYAFADAYVQLARKDLAMCHIFRADELEQGQGEAANLIQQFLTDEQPDDRSLENIKTMCLTEDS